MPRKMISTAPKTCPLCSRVFARKARAGMKQWAAQRFCSVKCDRATKSPPVKPCQRCQKPVSRPWAQKFCSRTCAQRFKSVDPVATRYRILKINGRKIAEHRYVMEQFLGRPLRTDEIVHHLNEDKLDNRLENLELTTAAEHGRHHMLGNQNARRAR